MSAGLNHQLLRLSALLNLERQARGLDRARLGFLMVNDTAQIIPYQQAALWIAGDGAGGRVAALSGLAVPDTASPYMGWLNRIFPHLAAAGDQGGPRMVTAAMVPPAVAAEWASHFPDHGVWCPLHSHTGALLGGMLFGRAQPWGDGDMHVLDVLVSGYAQGWELAGRPVRAAWHLHLRRRKFWLTAGAVAVVVAALFPVRQSVLAPAEVIPRDPMPIRAPFEGVVDTIPVAPNQHVIKGDVLVTLETTQMLTRLEVAEKARDMARADYAQTAQQALSDPTAQAKLAQLRAKIAQAEAEAVFLSGQLARANLTAPADGVAIFDDPADWIGRPVAVGERVMMVADPARVDLEIMVPVADVVTFAANADIRFFPNVAPDQPASATLTQASYASQVTPEGVSAHRFRAAFAEGDAPLRLGLKGTAKIYGETRPLILWLLRRPLAVMRQWLSL